MNRKYSGFTLVEMLIVMGIIIILMAVGIAAGRFAINRANDVAHQNAADQLFTAAQSYLTDEREYPVVADWEDALGDCTAEPCLNDYLSLGEFRGGTDATFYYWTNSAASAVLVCVSKGGPLDEDGRGFYCTGNGFGDDDAPAWLTAKDISPVGGTAPAWVDGWYDFSQDWDNENDVFESPVTP